LVQGVAEAAETLPAIVECGEIGRVYTAVYTCAMSARAKIFSNGGSQAVRLPKSVRFPDDQREVVVRRIGRRVILEPADEWSSDFLDALGAWDEPIDRPRSRSVAKRKDPFE
jgi:antitoxin VapB